ncbi:hypothetical protein HYV49_02585 [Candidatus Pacearchaeota archaeon]|nr:hypothetical protein [Candidatus Pacearchaeota archaeon]
MEHQTYGIYYDEEGDFLEITFGEPPEAEYTNEIEEGVFITRNGETNDIYSIGILSFKKRAQILKRLLKQTNKSLPTEIDIS